MKWRSASTLRRIAASTIALGRFCHGNCLLNAVIDAWFHGAVLHCHAAQRTLQRSQMLAVLALEQSAISAASSVITVTHA
jgi:hypothetical protein